MRPALPLVIVGLGLAPALAAAEPPASDPAREALHLGAESLAEGHINESLLAFEEVERDYPETPASRAAPEMARLALAYRDGGVPELPPGEGNTAESKYAYAFALLGHGRTVDAMKLFHQIRKERPDSPEAELAAALAAFTGELIKRDRRAPEGAKLPPDARGCLFFF